MKKLMLAVAIVCATAMSQAATCYWNVATYGSQKYYLSGGASTYTGTAYLFMVNGTSLTQQTILTALLAGSDVSKSAVATLTVNSGAIAKTSFTTDSTSGTSYSFFTVIDDGDEVWVGKTYSGSASELATGTSISLKDQIASKKAAVTSTTISGNAGAWYTVPEPTSGLLLLLGMAGLALKRKRA